MRETLAETWPELAIGLGGVFNIAEGKAKFHVMPDFSPCPINTNEVTDSTLLIKFSLTLQLEGCQQLAEVLRGQLPPHCTLGLHLQGPRP